MVLVDSSVLIDVLQDDPVWQPWSEGQMRAHAQTERLAINPIVWAELSMNYSSATATAAIVRTLELAVDEIPHPALFLAGRAFLQYQRRGGRRGTLLPDFFIGAHAAVRGWPLLTRDPTRIRSYFPTVAVIAPD